MSITTRAASALLGAVVALGAVGCVAAARTPVSEPPVDAEVVAEVVVPTPEPTVEPTPESEPIVAPEPEPEPALPEPEPVAPEPEPIVEEDEYGIEDEPPIPVGVRVYFDTHEETYSLIAADVPCWVDINERPVCWIEGAVDAEVQR